ncbi:class I SAM-dependent methyltransferase [Tardiphaga sp.]|uniref:class I SAM-dependent methyltransferase n=1 Tax=Tardiphaga sp. TaxID=1926292 RepID=UPI00352B25C7
MAERKKGLFSLLKYAPVYDTVQRIMRVDEIRAQFARDYICAAPGDVVLDIGCGPAHLLAHLPPVKYIGWEPNPHYVSQARRDYGDRGVFNVGLFGPRQARDLENTIDIAIVSAVLHHMNDSEAKELFALLSTTLKPGGRIVTLDNVFVDKQNLIAKFLISIDRGRHVRDPDGYLSLARSSFERATGDVVHRVFPPYTYFFMTARNID